MYLSYFSLEEDLILEDQWVTSLLKLPELTQFVPWIFIQLLG